ncbi:MAG: chorismate mutase [Lachnospiraceae bacterium]|nr:chorismate mutase [Lachnospiraceae bacterium]
MAEIDEYRKEIEIIDKEMAEMFERRMKCSYNIAAYKREHGLPILDAKREKSLIEKNSKYINDDEMRQYYQDYLVSVMQISKLYQRKQLEGIMVAYSGIEGSFASLAVSKIMPDANRIPYKNFADAYNAVVNGECEFAVLPIENSFAGEVGQVTDLMFNGELSVNGVYELKVSQCLLGVPGSRVDTIKTVISHPQALEQSNEYLTQHGITSIPFENTARAAKEVSEKNDITIGAVASRETAELYGLTILDHDINESSQNITRFAVFTRNREFIKNNNDYSNFILMFTVKNQAGTLAKAISVMGAYGYSMRVIRSRPMKNKNWQYYFYAEVEGNVQAAEQMINALENECELVKVVGTFKADVAI